MQISCKIGAWLLFINLIGIAHADAPYFVTYSHHLEEPGSLEIAWRNVAGSPTGGNPFLSSLLELEYGVNGWWTSELYLSGQTTSHESTVWTGWRWENRMRPLLREHWINPVLYVEYEDINGADKSLLAMVGHDGVSDQATPNAEARRERKRELETKLILSSYAKGWNIAENFIAEKNLNGGEWEFGYALAVSRALASKASPERCAFCRENFRAGVEMYGGLGTRHDFGLRETSHYVAPILGWRLPNGTMLGISPGFGVTGTSHQFLLRFNVGLKSPSSRGCSEADDRTNRDCTGAAVAERVCRGTTPTLDESRARSGASDRKSLCGRRRSRTGRGEVVRRILRVVPRQRRGGDREKARAKVARGTERVARSAVLVGHERGNRQGNARLGVLAGTATLAVGDVAAGKTVAEPRGPQNRERSDRDVVFACADGLS